MIVAFTKVGSTDDILIRENNKEYVVEVRKNLVIEHKTPVFEKYEEAEKFYEDILEKLN